MKHIVFTTLVALSSLCASAQSPQHYELKINDFSDLRVDNAVNVEYYCNPDSAGFAVFDCTKEQAQCLIFDNNGKGKLSVQVDNDRPTQIFLPVVKVYSTNLTKVVNSGDSLVKVYNLPAMDKFKAVLIGNGRLSIPAIEASTIETSIYSGHGQISIEGRCTEAKLHITGTGAINADRLDAVKVKTTIIGTGNIGCNPTEEITVQGTGSGTVYYRTTPPTIKSRGIGIKHTPMP